MSYAELICRTNYSFLTGASRPSELIERAAELGYQALAVTDRDGVYGMPKAYLASKEHPGLKLIVGAELTLEPGHPPLFLIARDRAAYGQLCRIITTSHASKPKGSAHLKWEELTQALSQSQSQGIVALVSPHEERLSDLKDILGPRLFLPLTRALDGLDRKRTETALRASHRFGARIVATNDVHFHSPERRMLGDTLAAIRLTTPLSKIGRKIRSNGERYLKSPAQMRELFRDLPDAIRHGLEIAESCVFSPAELRYRYPSEWIPKGESAQGYLERLTWEGASSRYPGGVPPEVRTQIKHELSLISQLQFADYFLTIWEIIEFARSRDILCQGRGSAANSAVCYCLAITAIDPVRMQLLFERFISAERGEPPDIDIDFEHNRREEVIQHIYEKYGRHRAAMVAACVTFRSRMATREVAKALEVDLLEMRGKTEAHSLVEEIKGFPRHLSIHSGGFTLSADPIIETVPVEPARMEGRTIVQWDKDDLDAIGLVKVDVLSLGMLTALKKTLDAVGLTLYSVPPSDPETYAMIRRADTVGVFQIESRAQMSMLPRLLPKNFYDLVIQIAIVRPGPIVGKMVHPYLRRRSGQEAVDYPHPGLKPILSRTLGVPLFQEQVMQMAISLGGFSPGEADQLRRAIGAWRSTGSIDKMGRRLMEGLLKSGLPQEFVTRIFDQIQGFAEYGFPESHSASFALLAYASCYLKCHHPAEFTCALINAQPMGFYSVHSLVHDLRRHGVEVLPVDPHLSDWDCRVVEGKLRLGFRITKGLGEEPARALMRERERRPFRDLPDFIARGALKPAVIHALAMGDAFKCFGLEQRDALWQSLALERLLLEGQASKQLNLFARLAATDTDADTDTEKRLFQALEPLAAVQGEYRAYGVSVRGHPMQFMRGRKDIRIPDRTTADARALSNGSMARVAGLVIVRQRPPTAKGVTFATLEDEHGFLDLILHKETFERCEEVFTGHSFLIADGKIQRQGLAISMLVKEVRPVEFGA